MKTVQIKGTNFITRFGKIGVKIGNSFYTHKEWRNFGLTDLRDMANLEWKDFLNSWKLFDKMYKDMYL